jgi:hypothetical protein
VANPSSYAWPAEVRPLPSATPKLNMNFTFGPFDATKAVNFDRWPSGLENRTGNTAQMTDDHRARVRAKRSLHLHD